jgi:hypothetical protein
MRVYFPFFGSRQSIESVKGFENNLVVGDMLNTAHPTTGRLNTKYHFLFYPN